LVFQTVHLFLTNLAFQVREWDEQFNERYPVIGKLLKPGEEPTNYSDDEEETEESKKEL
jgi:membrane-associated progesterone receptor component